MKKWFALAVLATAACHVAAKDWKHVRIASEGAYPPFNTIATDGSLAGLEIELGNAICAEVKLQCTWVKQDWNGMIPALMARKFDAVMASMSITEERKQKIDFSDKYYGAPLVLVGKSNSKLSPAAAALKSKKIAVQRGTIADNYATKYWTASGVTIVRYSKQDEAYADLTSGRADASLVDYWEAQGGFLNTAAGKNYAVLGGKISGTTAEERTVIGEGVGIAIRKQDADLKALLNKGIAAIRANGTYDKITKKYFKEDIYR